jgi:hypothetical protein
MYQRSTGGKKEVSSVSFALRLFSEPCTSEIPLAFQFKFDSIVIQDFYRHFNRLVLPRNKEVGKKCQEKNGKY